MGYLGALLARVGGIMAPLTGLLLLYAAVIVINVILSGFLWARARTALHRTLFLFWAFSAVSLVMQGVLTGTPLLMTLSFMSAFPIKLAMADLLARISDLTAAWRVYGVVFGVALVTSVVASALGAPFWLISLPAAISISVPVFHVGFRAVLLGSDRMSPTARAATITCLISSLHDMDYPFLRDHPSLSLLGFTIALLIEFAMSMTMPAVVLERVTAERTRIEQIGQLRSRFFANVSHELRTPLTMILAPLENLLGEELGPLNATQRAYLQSNQRNAVRLLKLINDLLDLARMEEGFLRLRPERTDLVALLEEVVAYSRPLAARKQLTLDLVVHGRPSDLQVDVEKIERVLVNLVSNALKFTSQGGVTLSLEARAGQVELVVSDTGIGIAADKIERVFDRFNQADGSVTRRFGGTGLGLAYAREIVILHGGTLTVESTPGRGSRFVVHLPEGEGHIAPEVRAGEAPPGPEVREPREWAQQLQRKDDYRFLEIGDVTDRRVVARATGQTSPTRILVVEDNPEILELINLQLCQRYTVSVAGNGQVGLEIARREHPDLIITDFMMPELDGLSMVQALRADRQFTETSIIMLTAKNQLEDRLAVREAGVDVYLGKPFSPRELEAAIRQLLERRGRHVDHLMRAHAEGLEIVSGGLAHEIQNPLTFIKGAQLMIVEQISKIREQIAGAALTDPARLAAIDRVKERIDRLVGSAGSGITRIEAVVALLRRYAREGFPKESVEVAFDAAVQEVTQLVAPPIDVSCRVELDLRAPGAQVRCIPEELNQVVRCLVQNATEAIQERGVVRVKTRREGQQLVLEVSDDGPGIAPEQVAKVFSPFFTTKPGTGRGLGLAIAELVVTRAGGRIEVASVPKVETTFRIRLPVATGAAPAPIVVPPS